MRSIERLDDRLPNLSILLAVLVALVAAANIANAGVVATGTNSPGPVISGTTNDYIIGSGAAGTLTINGGTSFTAGGLDAAAGGTGNGTITIDGSGTKVTLNPVGQSDVLDAGNWGIGSVTISGGAVVDGTNTASCAPGWCLSKVTNGAGSTGTLNITGLGSMLSLPNLLIVGFDVVNQPSPPLVFGTPGGASSGTLNVEAGGTLNTQDAKIGLQATNSVPPALGTETASGAAFVDGVGSTWNVTSPDNSGIAIGEGSNSTGSLSITNGGAVNVAATSPSLQAGISIGGTGASPGGTGSLTVNGGSLAFSTGDTFLNVGRSQGSGTMVVEGGGTVSGVFTLQVGRDGSNGSLTVDGAGSSIIASGNSTTNGAFLGVGIVDTPALAASLGASTTGSVAVENGGKITIDTDNNINNGMSVGVNGATGNVTVTGTGSQLAITGNNSNAASGGGATIGRSGTGTLSVLAGGHFNINDSGTVGQGGFGIGGSATQIANGEQPGTGTVTVSGAGSQLNVQSPHGFIVAGYTGTGTLDISNGGAVTAEGMTIGRNTGSLGIVSADGNGSSITLSGSDAGGGTGARLQVGGSGTGNMFLTNGAELLVNPTTPSGGVYIGGTGSLAGGVGAMTVSSGSEVLISGTGNQLIVGRNGTGTLTITGGSTVDVAHGAGSMGQTLVGAIPASASSTAPLSGTITVANGSTLNAGSLLGIASNGMASSTGSGAVFLTGGSTINATNVVIGANGLLDSDGTVNGNVTNNGGTISPGAPPDTLQVNGNFAQTGGKINLEIASDGHGGFLTDKLVFGTGAGIGITDATISFDFLGNADPGAFAADGLFNLDTFFGFANVDGTGEVPLSSEISGLLGTVFVDDTYVATSDNFNITSFGFDPNAGVTELVATPTPEPATAGLLTTALLGFFGVGQARRRYRLMR